MAVQYLLPSLPRHLAALIRRMEFLKAEVCSRHIDESHLRKPYLIEIVVKLAEIQGHNKRQDS